MELGVLVGGKTSIYILNYLVSSELHLGPNCPEFQTSFFCVLCLSKETQKLKLCLGQVSGTSYSPTSDMQPTETLQSVQWVLG